MGVPVSQIWTVATYVLARKLRGVERYPQDPVKAGWQRID